MKYNKIEVRIEESIFRQQYNINGVISCIVHTYSDREESTINDEVYRILWNESKSKKPERP